MGLRFRSIRGISYVHLSLYLGAFFLASPLYAELSPLEMKGVHDLVAHEYEYLSPVYGLTLLETKTLENRRFYGNYGPKKEGFSCFEKASQTHELLIKNQDCPQDSTAELVQRLFPSQDRAIFVANQIPSDPVSQLKPETIGQVLGRISLAKDSDFNNTDLTQKLTSDLKHILFEGIYPKKFYNKKIQELKDQTKRKDCSPEDRSNLFEEVKRLEAALKPYTESNQSDVTSPQGVAESKDFEALAQLIVNSLKESHLQKYPKHFTEQALLSFFWKKGDQKVDYLNLLQGMEKTNPKALKDPLFLKDQTKQKQFLGLQYTKGDFDFSKVLAYPDMAADDFIKNPEKLAFYSLQEDRRVKALPPILSYALAKHTNLKGGTYADCGETSLRNFLNIVLYNPKAGKFDVSYLDQIKAKNPLVNPYPGLTSFYQNHDDSNSILSQSTRDDWSETVASKHKGVVYKKGTPDLQCEITARGAGALGLDNILTLLNRLLFQSTDGKTSGTLDQAQGRAKKLDELCKTLSREGFELSWNLKGAKSSERVKINEMKEGVELEFSINRQPSFDWKFMAGHFIVQEIHQGMKSWKEQVGHFLATRLSKKPDSFSPLLLNWSAGKENWDSIGNLLNPAIQENLLYSLPLNSNEVKKFAFEKILSHPRVKDLQAFAERIEKNLPQNDLDTQRVIQLAYANHDYPFGDPKHALGNPEIKYTRVIDSEIQSKLGKAWKDEKTGLIWGDIEKDKEGHPLNMNREAAMKYCQAKGEDYRLPTKEEFEKFRKDLGYGTSQGYIPQFLPNLDGNYFWSSSVHLALADFFYFFNGSYGPVLSNHYNGDNQVRCCCWRSGVGT